MNFIYSYDDESKNKLLSNGYILICSSVNYSGKKASLFKSKKENKLDFNSMNVEFSNKMTF